MTRNELKEIIKECIEECGFIYNEGFSDYKNRSNILKQMTNWRTRSEKIKRDKYFKKDININEVKELINIYDNNIDIWIKEFNNIYLKDGYKSLYNLLKDIERDTRSSKSNSKQKYSENDLNRAKNDFLKLVNCIKVIVNNFKSSEEFKYKCNKSKNNFVPKLVVDIFEDMLYYKSTGFIGGAIIEIIDEDQEIRILYSWILHDIVNIIKRDYKEIYNKFNFEYGDEDEGCLYIDYKS